MRNFFLSLNLPRIASQQDVEDAVENLSEHEREEESDLIDIMLSETKAEQYRRVHLQYDAMAEFLKRTESENFIDTHQWPQRLVEFDSTE